MKKIIALAVAFTAITIVAGQEANAQSFSFNNGYQFGAGANAAHHGRGLGGLCNPGFGFGTFFGQRSFVVDRQTRPPYFAEFPPVYYNGIVRRPYGISPYAAPAGVTPVEMNVAKRGVEPMVVKNPFFKNRQNSTVRSENPLSILETGSEEEILEDAKSTKNKSTRIVNPYYKSQPGAFGSIMHASYDASDDN